MTDLRAKAFSLSRRGRIAGALSASVAAHADELAHQDAPGSAEAAGGAANWVLSLALQAATYAVPIVAMYNLRATTAVGPNAKVPPNEIWRVDNIASPEIAAEAGYVTPNVNVIYGFGFLDLHEEPVILVVPDSNGRYYMVQIVDMWTNAFAYVGGVATGYQGGIYALVGPGWRGDLPVGVTRIDCPTHWVEIQPRVHVKDQSDLPGARDVLHAIKVTGLAKYTGRPPPDTVTYRYDAPKINTKVASSQMQFVDPLQFWEIFSSAMNENPPPEEEIDLVLPQFKYLGIEFGKPWKREDVSAPILQQMTLAAKAIGPTLMSLLPALGHPANAWIIPPPNVGLAGADYPSRAIVAVFGLTANTPQEAIYYTAVTDGAGQPLTGAKRYAMTFQERTPCIKTIPPGFWSLSAYDKTTGFTVPNPINRYALGSDDQLKRNHDGTFTLYLQRDNPGPDKETNWLPVAPGPFYLIIRVYAPVPEIAAALKEPATFAGPPPLLAVG